MPSHTPCEQTNARERAALPRVLTINCGSSSIRFALYEASDLRKRLLDGKVDRIGPKDSNLTIHDSSGQPKTAHTDVAIGHRVVHGMTHTEPERTTRTLLDKLHRDTPYDPESELVEAFRARHPNLSQGACSDTAIHRAMPRPIPSRFDVNGGQCYGFHGHSYSFLMGELAGLGDSAATKGRVIRTDEESTFWTNCQTKSPWGLGCL